MKQAGLGDQLFVDGINLSGDTGSLQRIGGGLAGTQDVTGIDKSAFERRGLLRDGGLEWTAFFNPTGAHPALSALPTADRVATYCRGTVIGNAAASVVAKQLNYDPTREADGSLTIAVQAAANGFGLEWGRQLTGGSDNLAAAGARPGVDFAAATAFGLQAYLHVFTFVGTSATAAVQHSNDNGAVDPWTDVTGAVFAAATGVGAQRIQTSRTEAVKRWLRVNVTGVFTNLDFAVMVAKNDVAVQF